MGMPLHAATAQQQQQYLHGSAFGVQTHAGPHSFGLPVQYLTYGGAGQAQTQAQARVGGPGFGAGVGGIPMGAGAPQQHQHPSRVIVNETVTTYRDAPQFDLNRVYDVGESG